MNRKKILFILASIPLWIELFAMFFLPERVPIHYDSQFQVTGYGSKFLLLVVGVMTLAFGFFWCMVYQVCDIKQDKVLGTSLSSVENFSLEGVSSIKIKNMIFYTGIIALMICYVINAFGLFGAFFFG